MSGTAVHFPLERFRRLAAGHRCEQVVEVLGRPCFGPRERFAGRWCAFLGNRLLGFVFGLHGYTGSVVLDLEGVGSSSSRSTVVRLGMEELMRAADKRELL